MNARIAEVIRQVPATGDLNRDVDSLLRLYGREVTREHIPRAVAEGQRLAAQFGVSVHAATTALWLHDIGGIFRRSEMVGLCEDLGLEVYHEERQVPMLLHAKLSVVLAREWQGIHDPAMLQAIRFHTTLHAAPTSLDHVVFLADKLEWDQGGTPPYSLELRAALKDGLEAGTRCMLTWMASPEANLLIPHPDLCAAWTAHAIQAPT